MPVTQTGKQERLLVEEDHRTSRKTKKKASPSTKISWSRRVWHKCCDTWFFEVASVTFSAICIIAIFVFLRVLDRKETPSWSGSVSPNAIIATASTASKASALLAVGGALGQFKWLHLRTKKHMLKDVQVYDSATRGPLGSLVFLWHFKRAPWVTYTAFIGCAVTILAIAADPFTQQILRYEVLPTKDSGILATLKHAHAYDFGNAGLGGGSSVITGPRDLGATAAAVSGLFQNPLPLKFDCPSSNCTFPDFTTLGVHSYCKDITAQTTHHCGSNITSDDPNKLVCTYNLASDDGNPGITTLTAISDINAHQGFWHTTVNTNAQYWLEGGTIFSWISLVKFTSQTIYPNGSYVYNWRQSMEAWECTLSVVAFAYSNVSVKNGVLQTPSIQMSDLHLQSASNPGNGVWKLKADSSTWPEDVTYKVAGWDFFNFGLIMTNDLFTPSPGIWTTTLGQSALTAASNVSEALGMVASSMTHHMMSGSPNTTVLEGASHLSRSYIRVIWGWTGLLLALNVLTWILLVLAIILTRSTHSAIWKSSLYPLLTLNLREHSDVALYKLSEMERMSEQTKATSFVRPAYAGI